MAGDQAELNLPRVDPVGVPFVTTEQMIEVDRAMVEDYGIELLQMMENAGRTLATLAMRRFSSAVRGKVVVLAGVGGNGGGALVCARRLSNWGVDVQVAVSAEDARFAAVPRHQLAIAREMGISVEHGPPSSSTVDFIVDGIIGYGLMGNPRGPAADMIGWASGVSAPVLSLDVPSGVESTLGTVLDPAVSATATMTLALPKEGLRAREASTHVGELYLADISVPASLYANMGLEVGPIFRDSDIVRLG